MQKPGILAEPPQPRTSRARCVSWRTRVCVAGIALWGTYHLYSSLDWNGHLPRGRRPLHESNRTRVPSAGRNPAYLVRATNGAVASENELCSDIGVNILKDGGNAVDATVGTTLCIGVVNMFSYVPRFPIPLTALTLACAPIAPGSAAAGS